MAEYNVNKKAKVLVMLDELMDIEGDFKILNEKRKRNDSDIKMLSTMIDNYDSQIDSRQKSNELKSRWFEDVLPNLSGECFKRYTIAFASSISHGY